MFELIAFLVVMALLAVLGHGIWVAVAWLVKRLFGLGWSAETLPPASTSRRDEASERAGFRVTLARLQAAGQVTADEAEMLRQRESALAWQGLDAAAMSTSEVLAAPTEDLVANASGTTAAAEYPDWSTVEPPAPVHPLDEPDEAMVEEPIMATVVPAAGAASPGDSANAGEAVVKRPERRSWKEWLSGFLATHNIRWGELIAGLLIVFCSIGLVISLWNPLTEMNPFVPSAIFLAGTLAVEAAGIYTLRKWRLRHTSRAVLVIAGLLLPLSLVAGLAIAGGGGAGSPAAFSIPAAVLASTVSLAALWFAGVALTRRRLAGVFVAGVAPPTLLLPWVPVILLGGTRSLGIATTAVSATLAAGWLMAFRRPGKGPAFRLRAVATRNRILAMAMGGFSLAVLVVFSGWLLRPHVAATALQASLAIGVLPVAVATMACASRLRHAARLWQALLGRWAEPLAGTAVLGSVLFATATQNHLLAWALMGTGSAALAAWCLRCKRMIGLSLASLMVAGVPLVAFGGSWASWPEAGQWSEALRGVAFTSSLFGWSLAVGATSIGFARGRRWRAMFAAPAVLSAGGLCVACGLAALANVAALVGHPLGGVTDALRWPGVMLILGATSGLLMLAAVRWPRGLASGLRSGGRRWVFSLGQAGLLVTTALTLARALPDQVTTADAWRTMRAMWWWVGVLAVHSLGWQAARFVPVARWHRMLRRPGEPARWGVDLGRAAMGAGCVLMVGTVGYAWLAFLGWVEMGATPTRVPWLVLGLLAGTTGCAIVGTADRTTRRVALFLVQAASVWMVGAFFSPASGWGWQQATWQIAGLLVVLAALVLVDFYQRWNQTAGGRAILAAVNDLLPLGLASTAAAMGLLSLPLFSQQAFPLLGFQVGALQLPAWHLLGGWGLWTLLLAAAALRRGWRGGEYVVVAMAMLLSALMATTQTVWWSEALAIVGWSLWTLALGVAAAVAIVRGPVTPRGRPGDVALAAFRGAAQWIAIGSLLVLLPAFWFDPEGTAMRTGSGLLILIGALLAAALAGGLLRKRDAQEGGVWRVVAARMLGGRGDDGLRWLTPAVAGFLITFVVLVEWVALGAITIEAAPLAVLLSLAVWTAAGVAAVVCWPQREVGWFESAGLALALTVLGWTSTVLPTDLVWFAFGGAVVLVGMAVARTRQSRRSATSVSRLESWLVPSVWGFALGSGTWFLMAFVHGSVRSPGHVAAAAVAWLSVHTLVSRWMLPQRVADRVPIVESLGVWGAVGGLLVLAAEPVLGMRLPVPTGFAVAVAVLAAGAIGFTTLLRMRSASPFLLAGLGVALATARLALAIEEHPQVTLSKSALVACGWGLTSVFAVWIWPLRHQTRRLVAGLGGGWSATDDGHREVNLAMLLVAATVWTGGFALTCVLQTAAPAEDAAALTAVVTMGWAVAVTAQRLGRFWLRTFAVLQGVFAVVLVAFTQVEPHPCAELLFSMRCVIGGGIFVPVYGWLLPRLLAGRWSGAVFEGDREYVSPWRSSLQVGAVVSGVIAAVSLVAVFGLEFEASYRGTVASLSSATVHGFAALLGVLAALATGFAVRRSPLGAELSPSAWSRQRVFWIYGAQLLAFLTWLHLFLCDSPLAMDRLRPWWPFVVLGLAALTVAAVEWAKRRGDDLLAGTLRRTTLLLPLIPAVGFWLGAGEAWWFLGQRVSYAAALLAGSAFYLTVGALWRGETAARGLGVLLGNAAWICWMAGSAGESLSEHPQVWLLPPMLSLLWVLHVERERIPRGLLVGLRYAACLIIYVVSTIDIMVIELGQSLWGPLLLAGLAMTGVFAGMLLRVRSFLYTGTAFLLVALVSMVWHAQQSLDQVWPWWAFGIVSGLTILGGLMWAEKKKPQVKSAVRRLEQWAN